MRPGSTAWTDDEINTVITLRRAKRPIAEIASILSRSFDSVASKANNLRSIIEGKEAQVRQPAAVAQQHRTRSEFVTATLMGDPPAGRSALDQRQA